MQLKFTRISPLIVSDDFETGDIATPKTVTYNTLNHINSQPLLMRPMTINNQNPMIKIKSVKSKLIYRHMSINEPINQMVNIFDDETMKTLKPNEKGPQYDQQGAIKKSSVVGPMSLFGINSSKHLKLDDEEFIKSPTESSMSKKFDENKKKKNNNNIIKTNNQCILNSKEVENEIIRITQHVQSIQENENRTKNIVFKGIPIGDRNYLTKFERVNNRFHSTVEQWLNDEKNNGKLIGRVPQASVYRRCEETRTRNEFVQVLDNLIPEYERMGENFWQNNLRSSQRPQTSQGSGKVPVEIIRKPNSSKLKSRFEGKLPFSSFSSGKYFASKMSENKKEVELILEGDKASIADIEIQGTNVLRAEVQSLRCKLGTQNTFVKQLFLQNQGNVPEEIIGSQCSKNRWGSEKFDCVITSKMRN